MPRSVPDDLIDNTPLSIRPSPAPITVLPLPIARDRLQQAEQDARDYAAASKATNTLRAYRADWQHFEAWCAQLQLQPLPAEPKTVALYLSMLATDHKVATLERRLVAISQIHKARQLDSPTANIAVRQVLQGIRRRKGVAQEGKAPAMTDDVKAMVAGLPRTLHGIQERAVLLVGFAGAFRRSEIVGLDVADLAFTRAGLVVYLRRSKTDQEGEGRQVAIPNGSTADTCPVRALKAWLHAASITGGPVFRGVDRAGVVSSSRMSDQTVARAVKRGATRAGLDPALYAGHSLRSGLATSAAAAGASERSIMNQTGHRSEKMVRRYIRDANLFRENAAGKVGL